MNTDLDYNIKKPNDITSECKVIIMLHGYGSNKEDLFSFSDYMNPKALIISVQAPHKMDYGSYCWWALNFDESMNLSIEVSQARESINQLHKFISEYLVDNYNFSLNNIFLLGFSQGAMVAYTLSINYPDFYKKVIGLSGKIPYEIINYNKENDYSLHNYFCSHGIFDQVIPIDIGRDSSSWFTNKKIKHVFLEFQSQHGVSPENFEEMKSWIAKN
tara:strand:+ start:119 stop:766 length:648 start_codon:yes stop_codon:yes gene_type:complete